MDDTGWSWDAVADHASSLGQAAVVTVLLSVITIVAGTVIGVALGAAMTGRSSIVRALAWALAAPLRLAGTLPTLVLLVWLHVAAPQSTAWLHGLLRSLASALEPRAGAAEVNVLGGVSSHAFATATLALTIVLAAAVARIVRTAVRGVPADVLDAAKAHGMSPAMRLRRIVVPESWRAGVVSLLSAYIANIRLTTLAAFIGCNELLLVAYTTGVETSRDRELLTVLAAAYLAVLVPAALLVRQLERSRWITRR